MTPAALFTRCGHALCGDGPRWKEQFATMLGVRTNTVDNMAKGTSRIPPGMWSEIAALVQDRREQLAPLHAEVLLAAER